jgi:hypothetical protein
MNLQIGLKPICVLQRTVESFSVVLIYVLLFVKYIEVQCRRPPVALGDALPLNWRVIYKDLAELSNKMMLRYIFTLITQKMAKTIYIVRPTRMCSSVPLLEPGSPVV